MARPPKNPEAAGVYRRGEWFWLRHTVEGKEVRQPLRTRIYEEAIRLACELRGQVPIADAKNSWNSTIERYLREKQSPKRPLGYKGSRWQMFRPGTVPRVRSCLKNFANWSGVPAPSRVTLPMLERYAERVTKTSKAGGRTTMATIQAFLAHVGCLPGRVQLPTRKELERRELIVPIGDANALIDKAPNDALRFVLFCGFHAGLRSGEIRHACPEWFQLRRKVLRVPQIDGDVTVFQAKDSESREIPLSPQFLSFLQTFLPTVKRGEYCLRNPTKRRSKGGTYDFRTPFKTFVGKNGWQGLYPHAMRHSWITELCNSGNHTIQEIAAWSGDNLETIEKNYWHKRTVAGALDHTMQGKRKEDEANALVERIATQVGVLVRRGKINTNDLGEGLQALVEKEEEGIAALETLLANLNAGKYESFLRPPGA